MPDTKDGKSLGSALQSRDGKKSPGTATLASGWTSFETHKLDRTSVTHGNNVWRVEQGALTAGRTSSGNFEDRQDSTDSVAAFNGQFQQPHASCEQLRVTRSENQQQALERDRERSSSETDKRGTQKFRGQLSEVQCSSG